MTQKGSSRRLALDKVVAGASPHFDPSEVSSRPLWWWVLFAPGAIILWFQYMWPKTLHGFFGSARRKNVPLVQIIYTICFYFVILIVSLFVISF